MRICQRKYIGGLGISAYVNVSRETCLSTRALRSSNVSWANWGSSFISILKRRLNSVMIATASTSANLKRPDYYEIGASGSKVLVPSTNARPCAPTEWHECISWPVRFEKTGRIEFMRVFPVFRYHAIMSLTWLLVNEVKKRIRTIKMQARHVEHNVRTLRNKDRHPVPGPIPWV